MPCGRLRDSRHEGASERDDVARKIQDATSWLGSIAEQSGELGLP
jgi:hypothetical protein